MGDESPYKISFEEFQRNTPRVHGQPPDPDDPDGEIAPATAFAEVVHPEPPPNPNMIEGMLAGLGKIGAAGSQDDVTARRVNRVLLVIAVLIALTVAIGLAVSFL